MNNNLLILGAGGHGRVVKEVAEAMRIFDKIDFLDDDLSCSAAIGVCSDSEKLAVQYKNAFVAFGNNEHRMFWLKKVEEFGFNIPMLIHPTAYVSPSATIHSGSIIEANAMVNTNSVIGKGCILGMGAIIDHDSFVGSGCHVDCGAIIKSHARIEANSKIESGEIITSNHAFNNIVTIMSETSSSKAGA